MPAWFKVLMAAWIVWFLFVLSLIGGAVYVAIHFISKYW